MLRSAASFYRRQQRTSARAVLAARRAWRRLDFQDLDGSWPAVERLLLPLMVAAQTASADSGADYVDRVLAEQDIDADAEAQVRTVALVGVASDGRDLDTLLYSPVTAVKARVGDGWDQQAAMTSGQSVLDRIVATQVQDIGRVAVGLAMVARPSVHGYTRMLNPPSCSRCAVLAGKFFRWNTGFQRHPHCDCVHIPTQESLAGDLTTDPNAYFHSLNQTDQNRLFTNAGAQAIRDGADLGQVVNARRGAFGLTPAGARLTNEEARALRNGLNRGRLQTQRVFGRDLFTTTEGTTKRGTAGRQMEHLPGGRKVPRLMPESIYQIAGADRAEAIRLLRRFGYLL